MPLFGKSRLEKATEKRDELLRYIRDELKSKKLDTSPNRSWDHLLADIEQRLMSDKTNLLLQGEESKAITTITDDLGETKYYFLRALQHEAGLIWYMAKAEGKGDWYWDIYRDSTIQLVQYLWNSAVRWAKMGNFLFAEKELEAAYVEVEKVIKYNDSYEMKHAAANMLSDLARYAASMGNFEKGSSLVREAQIRVDMLAKRPSLTEIGKQALHKLSEEFDQLLAQINAASEKSK